MSLTKVSEKIQEERKKQGITTVEYLRVMQNHTRLSVGTIYRIINNPERAKFEKLRLVVEYVGLTMDEVLDQIQAPQEQAME